MSTHTIGEVLNQLRDEFDDITISKIRFLESEGLISPDRTESGYRKFTRADIDRLRYVLRAQRDRYLPLKVIREELDRLDAGLSVQPPAQGELLDDGGPVAPGVVPGADASTPATGGLEPSAADEPSLPSHPVAGNDQLDTDQLAAAAGIGVAEVAALVEHGLLGAPPYDAEAVTIASLSGKLLGGGLEARHLRMYRQFVERELSLAEQLVTPLLRQRNPDSRAVAGEQADLLASAGAALHRALLVQRLRRLLHP
ncbi:MAG: MerR family transcriptional regulator [Nitriliruptoraceae bacterium]